MKAISIGILSAFVYSYGSWAIARTYDLNHDPFEAGLIKSIASALLIALPIGVAAHTLVAFLRWKILSMVPVALGIAFMAAALLCVFNSPENQLINILAFVGLSGTFSLSYVLVLNRKPDEAV